MRHRHELTNDEFARIEPLLSGRPGTPGRNATDNRQFINAVLWIARTGAPWSDLPERFGTYDSVYQRFNRWAKKGRWQAIFEALQEPDLEWTGARLDSGAGPPTRGRSKKAVPPLKPSGAAGAASRQKSTSPATRLATRS